MVDDVPGFEKIGKELQKVSIPCPGKTNPSDRID